MPIGQAPCGTMPGWRRHNTLGTEPCMPCLVARSNWDRDRKLAPVRRAILEAEVAIFEKRRGRQRAGAA